MTGCPDCGQQTPRAGRCKQCAIVVRPPADDGELDEVPFVEFDGDCREFSIDVLDL